MDSVSNVGVLDKAVGVLKAIEMSGPLTLIELQAATGMPRATLHRLAVALESHGLLRRETSGRFCLGLGLVALGAVATETFPIAGLARPRLVQLGQETGESVQLYVRDGDRRRCAVSLPSPHGLRWMVGEGALLPLHRGSAGRVLSGESGRRGWVETVEERETGVA
ncbi:MAG: helix-turn-helix domain-containing protein, partial [Actinomycetota bacterium]|nr:helix-turn-helix domain-containing protein [Actinomycetota bacterium]